jgi:hypothetical protein
VCAHGTIRFEEMGPRKGPSIVKARKPSLVSQDRRARLRVHETAWRELFAKADAVSEGSVRDEPEGRVWYGTTSLILHLPLPVTHEERHFLAAVAARDLHVRLRAIRIAHREAQSRAPAALDIVSTELRVSHDPEGVRIDVDIQAPLIEGRLGTSRR